MLETPQYVFSRVSDALCHKLLTPVLKARSLESPTTSNVKTASKKTFQEHVRLATEKDHIFFMFPIEKRKLIKNLLFSCRSVILDVAFNNVM